MSEASVREASAWRRLWRRAAPPLVVSVFYFGVLVYPVLRIRMLLRPDVPGTAELLVVMVGPLLGRLAYEFFPGRFTRWLSALSLTWLGICFMAFLLVLSFEALHWLVPLTDTTWGLTLTGILVAFTVFAFVNAQRLHTREIAIPAPAAVAGTRIAQITDVHVGSRSGRFLTRVIRRVNAAKPDYVLITGDLIDFRDITAEEIEALGELAAPAYFIIGNHERYVDLEAICDRLRSLRVRVLRNETLMLPGIQLVGIDDAEPKTQVGRVLPGLAAAPDAYRIVLYHRPDGADDAARWGADLMLCGHTHNGQIVPFNYVVRRVFPRIHGLYQVGDMQLYVSPGTGTWGPILRLGSRSEISLFTLVATRSV
ncbi:MAG: metallophosphoesterase [Pseudomonadales bacterium]